MRSAVPLIEKDFMIMLNLYSLKASSMMSSLSSGIAGAGPLNFVLIPAKAIPQTVFPLFVLKLELTDIFIMFMGIRNTGS